VLVFQLKLGADAFRDFLLSPLSLVAFVIDAIRRPKVENSLYLRLMLIGRRSDRFINLFDDHRDGGQFTIDRAVDDLEEVLRSRTTAAEEVTEPPAPDRETQDTP